MPRPTAEQLFRPGLRGPLSTRAVSANNQWAGTHTLASGAATVTVSTTVVDSDSIIRYGVRAVTAAGSAGLVVCVSTISPGNFFTFATIDAVVAPRDLNIMWEVVKVQ
jgi:hypothetical protein